MLAIIETGGKQYQVEEGRYVDIELLETPQGEKVVFDKVVMIVAGENSKVGQPYVEEAAVTAEVLKHDKDKKIIVYKQRRKKGYRKKQGHRQNFTRVMVEAIEFPGKAEVLAAMPKEEEKAENPVKIETQIKEKKTTKKPEKTKTTEELKTAAIEETVVETVETPVVEEETAQVEAEEKTEE